MGAVKGTAFDADKKATITAENVAKEFFELFTKRVKLFVERFQ